jgi:MATE family multidrug resistance protein
MISNIGACVIQYCLNCIVVWNWGWGMLGCGLTLTFANCLQFIFLTSALYYYDDIRPILSWPKFDGEHWQFVKEYLTLGFPSMIMAFLEIAGVEVFQPLSGYISTYSNAAQAIVMNLYACLFTFYLGASIATAIFVGAAIGENNIKAARVFAKTAQLLVLCFTVCLAIFLFFMKEKLVSCFTSNTTIQTIALPALLVLSAALIPDCVIYCQVGVMRGLGKQKMAAWIQIAGFFVISIPIGCVLAYVYKLNISGFWTGFLIRSVIVCAVFAVLIWKVLDWEAIAVETQEREKQLREMIAHHRKADGKGDYGTINSDEKTEDVERK